MALNAIQILVRRVVLAQILVKRLARNFLMEPTIDATVLRVIMDELVMNRMLFVSPQNATRLLKSARRRLLRVA